MKQWNYFTSKEIKPQGWLRRQLEIQAEGLCGNLDKIWPDVRDSGWIGGDAEGWERAPYWLDGFIPLAYLLEDQKLIERAKKYMDTIILRQEDDGWLCPHRDHELDNYDASWAILLFSKSLTVYYECSGDERIPTVLYRMLKSHYDRLKSGEMKLFRVGYTRWFEGFVAIRFLWERTGEAWLKDYARILKTQGVDPESFMTEWRIPQAKVVAATHIVNVCMLLKYEALTHELLDENYQDKAEYMYNILRHYNGTPVGTFTGDEHLAGLSPISGTELCAVVEEMYSFEQLFAYTGDMKWLDRLEVVAFNALPATLSDDMWAHQYVQQSNQINCKRFPLSYRTHYTTNLHEANMFGLQPHFGCCTVNHSQGFPKLALSAFAYHDDVVINTLPIPSKLTSDLCDISIITEYPFKNHFVYQVKAKKKFDFKIRIPSFAINLRDEADECDKQTLTFHMHADEERTLSVSFDAPIEFIDRPYSLKTVKRGSLVFSLPIEYEKKMFEYEANHIERKFPYCDYEYIGKSDWNYGFSDVTFECEEREINEYPFSSEHPAVVIRAKMKKIPWGHERFFEFVCAHEPSSREPIGPTEEKELYPYGNAKLRMTEMPLVP